MFQSYNLISGSTAAENVEVPAMYAGVELHARHERSRELLTRLGLSERVYFLPNQLSGGQQQRVSISRALMNGGEIILADEPTGALDSKSGVEVMKLLDELSAQGHTVILITHAKEVADHARRVIEIRDGHIVADPGPTISEEAPPVHSWTARRGRMSQVRHRLRVRQERAARPAPQHAALLPDAAGHRDRRGLGDHHAGHRRWREEAGGGRHQLAGLQPAERQRRRAATTRAAATAARPACRWRTWTALERARCRTSSRAMPYQEQTSQTFRYKDRDIRAKIIGTSPNFTVIRNWPVAEGTLLHRGGRQHLRAGGGARPHRRRHAVPGWREPPRRVHRDGQPEPELPGHRRDGAQGCVARTATTRTRRCSSPTRPTCCASRARRYVSRIQVAVEDVNQILDTQADIEDLMAERHGQVDFRIFNMGAMLDQRVEQERP